jgi:hypothetical protein
MKRILILLVLLPLCVSGPAGNQADVNADHR